MGDKNKMLLQMRSPEPEVVEILAGPLDEEGFKFTAVGLEIQPWVTYEQWERYGRKLQLAEKGIQWALGDWVIFGEAKFKERAAQAVEFTGLKIKTLQNYATVAEAVEKSRRRDSDVVDFSTHAEVASLPADEQERILTLAEEDPVYMTRDRVRREVHKVKRRMGKEKSEIEIIQSPEVQDWLHKLHSELVEKESSVPLTAPFLRSMVRFMDHMVLWQSERTIDSDCDTIMGIFDAEKETAPYSATDGEIFKWLQGHGYFMRDPELDERLELLCEKKRLKYVQTGGRKEGQKGDMTWVYMPFGQKVFD